MKQITALAAVASLFLAGLLIGTFGTHLYYTRALRGPAGPTLAANRIFAGRFAAQLDLSAEQEREIRLVFARSRQRAEEMRREMGPQVRQMMEETAAEVEAVLNAEQRLRFQEMRRRHGGRLERFLLGPPEGGPHAGRGPHPRRPAADP